MKQLEKSGRGGRAGVKETLQNKQENISKHDYLLKTVSAFVKRVKIISRNSNFHPDFAVLALPVLHKPT